MKDNLNILITDDNKHFINAFRYLLIDSFGDSIENIYFAHNGEECLEILNQKLVNIVFLDIEMPVMNGVETTKRIMDHYRGIVVVALSFHGETAYVKQMIDAGARYYIVKEDVNKKQLMSIFDTVNVLQ